MAKILLLEDDELLGETLEDDLSQNGFTVTWVKDGDSCLDASYKQHYDLYLFDVNVPNMSGFEILSSLRNVQDETPAIFLTARSQTKDLKKGFEVGADDYITKPFNFTELLIRVEAKIKQNHTLNINKNVSLDCTKKLLCIKDTVLNLRKMEFEILRYYLLHKERVISKNEIVDMLYNGEFISDATFRVYIKNLNTHLDGYAKFKNIRGVGYRIESV